MIQNLKKILQSATESTTDLLSLENNFLLELDGTDSIKTENTTKENINYKTNV